MFRFSFAGKLILNLLLVLIPVQAFSKNYYFSTSKGNDSYTSAQAQNSSTPWKTIDQLNRSMSIFNPGDSILFRKGEVFQGRIILTRSGSGSSRIVFASYGSGSLPVIKGTLPVSGWTKYSGNIWQAAFTPSDSVVSNLFINGKAQQIGRFPNADATNKGYLKIESHTGKTSLTSSSLSGYNWTGAEVCVRCTKWILNRSYISSQAGSTINLLTPTSYEMTNNFGFFIQNHINTLDQNGEWYFNPRVKKIYIYLTTDPNNYQIEATSSPTIFESNGYSYFTIYGLELRGSVTSSIKLSGTSYASIKNCIISESGNNASDFTGCNNLSVSYNRFIRNNNNAMYFNNCSKIIVNGNKISATGLRAGMGLKPLIYTAINLESNYTACGYNVIDSSGYNGILFSHDSVNIHHNYINQFCLTLNDGGGIYCATIDGTVSQNRILEKNIILNGRGETAGTNTASGSCFGIYLDSHSDHIVLTGNTVSNSYSAGIYLHNAHNVDANNNTLYANASGPENYSSQMLLEHDHYSGDDPLRNISLNNNIYFAKTSSQNVFNVATTDNDIRQFGSSDYNYFAKPVNNSLVARLWEAGLDGAMQSVSLEGWQTYSGKDSHSSKSPVTVTDANTIRFEYNSSSANKTISLGGNYIDVKGNKYGGTITLLPFTSAVLIPDPNGTTYVPVSPAYVGSVVENATPAEIDITYDMNLANIVPSASSFKVAVNAVARPVTTVSVSGNKVNLSIDKDVLYGDSVTVQYIKPSVNPLQSTSGGQAESLPQEPVLNNSLEVPTVAETPEKEDRKISIYPNPAQTFINIAGLTESDKPLILRIIDLSGKLCLENAILPQLTNRIQFNLKPGNYILTILMGSVKMFSQKMIVHN